MDNLLINQIRIRMNSLSTQELRKIFEEHDRSQYSEETFEAIRQILLERGEPYIPPTEEDYKSDQYINLDKLALKRSSKFSWIYTSFVVIAIALVLFLLIYPSKKPSVKTDALQVISWVWSYDEYGQYIIGTVKNNSNEPYANVQIEFELYNTAGELLGSAYASVFDLKPKATQEFKSELINQDVTSATLKQVIGW